MLSFNYYGSAQEFCHEIANFLHVCMNRNSKSHDPQWVFMPINSWQLGFRWGEECLASLFLFFRKVLSSPELPPGRGGLNLRVNYVKKYDPAAIAAFLQIPLPRLILRPAVHLNCAEHQRSPSPSPVRHPLTDRLPG